MAVDPEFQSQGVAKSLLQATMALARVDKKDIYLVSSPAGTHLYWRAGFEKLREFDVLDHTYTYTAMILRA